MINFYSLLTYLLQTFSKFLDPNYWLFQSVPNRKLPWYGINTNDTLVTQFLWNINIIASSMNASSQLRADQAIWTAAVIQKFLKMCEFFGNLSFSIVSSTNYRIRVYQTSTVWKQNYKPWITKKQIIPHIDFPSLYQKPMQRTPIKRGAVFRDLLN